MCKKIVVLTSLLFFTFTLWGARPYTTDDYGTVDRGTVEVEIGNNITPGAKEYSTYLNIKHGITDRMEIDLTFDYDYPGISPLNLFYKLKIIDRTIWHFTVSISHNIGDETFDLNSIFSYESDKFLVNLNLGNIDRFNSLTFGLSPIFDVNEKFSIGIDINSAVVSKEFESANIMFGIVLSPISGFAVDAGVAKDIMNDSSINFTFGMTIDF